MELGPSNDVVDADIAGSMVSPSSEFIVELLFTVAEGSTAGGS